MGNAVIAAEHADSPFPWEVITDAGTIMRLNDAELAEFFWPPQWVMNVSTSPGVVARAALADPAPVVDDNLPVVHQTAPERIWLYLHGANENLPFKPDESIIWSPDQIDPSDIPYIRADLGVTTPAPVVGAPTDEEIDALWWQAIEAPDVVAAVGKEGFRWGVRQALARYGTTPAPVPVPVSERLPGAEDCDAEGRCWWLKSYGYRGHNIAETYWILTDEQGRHNPTCEHWLPANALPLPEERA